MTSLHLKLNQLSLTTMSRQLDQMITDAASKNMGFTQALETLTDLELDARNGRAIERRFRMSRLHAQHSIDSFQFKHHKTRMDAKNRIVRLLDLEFLSEGHQRRAHRESRCWQDLPGQSHRLAGLPGQSSRSVHHRDGHAQSPKCISGRSLARS